MNEKNNTVNPQSVALPDLPLTPYRRSDDAPLWDTHHLHAYALRYADMLTTPPAQPATVPKGWKLEKNANGTITINCPIGGAVVSALPDADRLIPESILHSLASAMLEAASQPAQQELLSNAEIAIWAERHDIQGTPADLRCMVEDAASLRPTTNTEISGEELVKIFEINKKCAI